MHSSHVNLQSITRRFRREPHLLLPALTAWLKGWWYKLKFKLLLKDFSAGPYFRVYGSLHISGPGKVEFGSNCLIIGNAIKPVYIRTLTPTAEVILADNTGLNGTAIQCVEKVSIGKMSNLADAYITDTASHSLSSERREETISDLGATPVHIGENVWVSVQVVILHGVHIGDNSVIGACSLVRKDIPEDVFAAGNPIAIIKSIND